MTSGQTGYCLEQHKHLAKTHGVCVFILRNQHPQYASCWGTAERSSLPLQSGTLHAESQKCDLAWESFWGDDGHLKMDGTSKSHRHAGTTHSTFLPSTRCVPGRTCPWQPSAPCMSTCLVVRFLAPAHVLWRSAQWIVVSQQRLQKVCKGCPEMSRDVVRSTSSARRMWMRCTAKQYRRIMYRSYTLMVDIWSASAWKTCMGDGNWPGTEKGGGAQRSMAARGNMTQPE